MKRALLIGVATLSLSVASTFAHAAPLTLDLNPTTTYQQTQNSPCVIGDPSCNNPAGFGSSTLAPNQSTYTNVGSPTYTVQQIRDLVGNGFMVGIDVNTTTSPMATEILDSFRLDIAGSTAFSYTGPTQLTTNNNGNGRSDALISGFDLSSFLATATAQFFVSYHNATDGREEFFLINGETSHVPVPEPGSMALLAFGLLTANWVRRKRSST
jgi:hypothetical protein